MLKCMKNLLHCWKMWVKLTFKFNQNDSAMVAYSYDLLKFKEKILTAGNKIWWKEDTFFLFFISKIKKNANSNNFHISILSLWTLSLEYR